MKPTIQPHNIMPLINKEWDDIFAQITSNKKAITERGWNPYNCALLLNSQIRSTMTDKEKGIEAERNKDIIIPSIALQNIVDVTNDSPNYDPEYLLQKEIKDVKALNVSLGTATFCLQTLVAHEGLHQARAQIKRNRDKGSSFCQKIESLKRVSAGIVFKEGST